jgi:hypothetical protein
MLVTRELPKEFSEGNTLDGGNVVPDKLEIVDVKQTNKLQVKLLMI